jgi:isoquinoline 1-oxidoreductase beta subunit
LRPGLRRDHDDDDSRRLPPLVLAASAAAGLSLGFHVPFGGDGSAAAAEGVAEVNAWVVVRPDETVVIRIARSEMGQGTLTGLAQLVAEELECDWARVPTEYPTPGQNLAAAGVGQLLTGGSRGIRDSHEYVRKGGAAAREMLVRAAAQGWGVPASECRAAAGVITHAASGRTTTYGKVGRRGGTLPPPADVRSRRPRTGRSPASR